MSSIEERLSAGPRQVWIPDPAKAKDWLKGGDDRTCYQENPVIGTAVDLYQRENDFGKYDVLVLSVPDVGEVAVHCRGTVLQREMQEARPAFGEKVGVEWTGEKTGARGTYPTFKVVVEREAGKSFRWTDEPSEVEPPTPSFGRTEVVDASEDDDGVPFLWMDSYFDLEYGLMRR